jgi:membrane fusion protein (multidrug efflux system)
MEENTGKKQKIFTNIFCVLIIAGIIGGGYWWYYDSHYITTDDARITGTIVSIGAKIPGRVIRLEVEEGDVVKAGRVLCRLDAREIAATRAQAKANLSAAKAKYNELVAGPRPQEIERDRAKVEKAAANLDYAARQYDRMQKLHKDGAISISQLESTENSYRIAVKELQALQEDLSISLAGTREESVQAALAQVQQSEAAVQALELNHENTDIIAPDDGVVALKSVNVGQVVSAGQSLFQIVEGQDLWLNARIKETEIGRVKIGQRVEYTFDSYPGQTFYGQVYDVGMAASSVFSLIPVENGNSSGNFTKVTQLMPIKITLPKDAAVIFRPGMSANIKIHLKE